jgi:hypothetical protein
MPSTCIHIRHIHVSYLAGALPIAKEDVSHHSSLPDELDLGVVNDCLLWSKELSGTIVSACMCFVWLFCECLSIYARVFVCYFVSIWVMKSRKIVHETSPIWCMVPVTYDVWCLGGPQRLNVSTLSHVHVCMCTYMLKVHATTHIWCLGGPWWPENIARTTMNSVGEVINAWIIETWAGVNRCQ